MALTDSGPIPYHCLLLCMAQNCFTAWRLFISYIYFCCADVCARVSPGVYVPHPGLHGLCCHIARVSLQVQPECLYAGGCPPRDVNGISSSTCYFISTLRLRWDNSLGQRGRWEWSRATCFLFFLAVGFQLGKQVKWLSSNDQQTIDFWETFLLLHIQKYITAFYVWLT